MKKAPKGGLTTCDVGYSRRARDRTPEIRRVRLSRHFKRRRKPCSPQRRRNHRHRRVVQDDTTLRIRWTSVIGYFQVEEHAADNHGHQRDRQQHGINIHPRGPILYRTTGGCLQRDLLAEWGLPDTQESPDTQLGRVPF